eukprot:TRINITY_DN2598_c0_g2_i1.p1 TRINITY_DN2598_c0_g2~~TRINITY_DN2598_c0_g2_i1.p1  ORF type:complete len:288 (-),score=53.13 TRINITY_DN2598_c0_g2_i1:4-867(-)
MVAGWILFEKYLKDNSFVLRDVTANSEEERMVIIKAARITDVLQPGHDQLPIQQLVTSSFGWKRDLLAEGIESNPGPDWKKRIEGPLKRDYPENFTSYLNALTSFVEDYVRPDSKQLGVSDSLLYDYLLGRKGDPMITEEKFKALEFLKPDLLKWLAPQQSVSQEPQADTESLKLPLVGFDIDKLAKTFPYQGCHESKLYYRVVDLSCKIPEGLPQDIWHRMQSEIKPLQINFIEKMNKFMERDEIHQKIHAKGNVQTINFVKEILKQSNRDQDDPNQNYLYNWLDR